MSAKKLFERFFFHPLPHGRGSVNGRTAAVVMALVMAIVWVGGCAQPRSFTPQVDPQQYSDAQFVHYLGTVPVVTFGEACRAVLIAADGQDGRESYEARYDALRTRDAVRDTWGLRSNDVVDRGTLAFMAARACQLPPTVDTALFGSWGLGDRRYALKQAARWEIVSYGPTYQPITGGEMVHVLAHMDKYMADNGLYAFDAVDIDAPADISSLEDVGSPVAGGTEGVEGGEGGEKHAHE